MRWLNSLTARLSLANLALLIVDVGLVYVVPSPVFATYGMALIAVLIVVHLSLCAAMPWAIAKDKTRPMIPIKLERLDQNWLDGKTPEDDLSDVERKVLATRRDLKHV